MEAFRSATATIVVDFAHTPDALEQVLSALREHLDGRRLICVFGCGGERDRSKRALMGAIAERLADSVVVTDDNPRREDAAGIRQDILAGMLRNTAMEIADRRAAIEYAWQQAGEGDIVLLAGKGHETIMQRGDLQLAFSDREIAARLTGCEA
jgi:UDP-N-acetylmuramoyl-L-alanyl-D-glutamate--2,6-diaminopimelate ligase